MTKAASSQDMRELAGEIESLISDLYHHDVEIARRFRPNITRIRAALTQAAAQRKGLVELDDDFGALRDAAYCAYIDICKRPECCGADHKIEHGKFGRAELKAHTDAAERLGQHRAFHSAATALRAALHPEGKSETNEIEAQT